MSHVSCYLLFVTVPSQNTQSSPPSLQQPPQTPKKLILVAEDDKFYANIYQVKLSKENYNIVIAKDGAETLKLARKQKPDLILLDLVMPIKDGFEVLTELRADPYLKDTKVVVLSNLGQNEDVQKAKNLGAIDYLIKTNFSIQQMIEKIKSYLK